MNNIQHSSARQTHYTPTEIICKCRLVFRGNIGLDPASDDIANDVVRADRFFSKGDKRSSLDRAWRADSVFLNPPGGKIRGKSSIAMFWDKFFSEFKEGNFDRGIFLGFSLELLPKRIEILSFPTLFFGVSPHLPNYLTGGGRVKFLNQDLIPQKSPTHGSFLTLVCNDDDEQTKKLFYQVFKNDGVIVSSCDAGGS